MFVRYAAHVHFSFPTRAPYRLPWARRPAKKPSNDGLLKTRDVGGTSAPPPRINPRCSPSARPDSQVHHSAYPADPPATGLQHTPAATVRPRTTTKVAPPEAGANRIGDNAVEYSLYASPVSLTSLCVARKKHAKPHTHRPFPNFLVLVRGISFVFVPFGRALPPPFGFRLGTVSCDCHFLILMSGCHMATYKSIAS